jgi:23S rRNA (pseudouridine1915-N3)-methyltransferase
MWYTGVGGLHKFETTLMTVGKLNEKFYLSAAAEYEKRLKGYCQFRILELPESRLSDNPSPNEIQAGLEKEADMIFDKIPKGAWLCIFTPEGKLLSSEDLAKKLGDVKNSGKSSACFLIGSSFGISPRVKQKADFRLSMSPMTFPHHLARIMVLEQLYRAEAIQAGSKYHK